MHYFTSYFLSPDANREENQSLSRKRRRSDAKTQLDDDADAPMLGKEDSSETGESAWEEEEDDEEMDDEEEDRGEELSTLPSKQSEQERLLLRIKASKNFPHAPLNWEKTKIQRRRAIKEHNLKERLAELTPPILFESAFNLRDQGYSYTPKRRHVAVLTAILHRCVLEKDFVRAGRALGMLLRTEFDGRAPDIRVNGLWEIAAEILLRAETKGPGTREGATLQHSNIVPGASLGDLSPERESGESTEVFTQEGFLRAKSFYERLILGFPYERYRGTLRLSALQFYPAMFGLWIAFVQDQHQRAVAKAMSLENRPDNELDTDCGSDHLNEDSYPSKLREAYQMTIQRVKEISERVDQAKQTWPYYEDPRTLNVEQMLYSWLSDVEEELRTIDVA